MATYNSTDNYWTVSLGKNGTTRLYLSEIITDENTVRFNIDNTPTPEHLNNLNDIINNVYEPICINFTSKIKVLPSYYSFNYIKTMNTDGSSQHNFGQALDIDVASLKRNITNKQLFEYIRLNIETDQLIWEFGTSAEPEYVHVSFVTDNNRGNVLILKRKGTNYENFEVTPTIFGGFKG